MLCRALLALLLIGCAVFVVRAEEEATAEVAAAAKPEALEARYAGGNSNNNNNNGGGSSNNNDNNDSSNNRGNGHGSGRGSGSGSGRGSASLEALAGSGLRNKVINEGTRYLGTQKSYSGSKKVVRSRKDNWFNKNFENTVTTNLKTLAKKVHVDTKVLVKKPLTVDNLKVHQQTNYVKNIYPKLEKVWVEQYKEVVAPSHAETVSKSASASRRTVRHQLQVSSSSRHRNLGTRYEGTQELGVIGGNGGGRGGSSNNNSGNNNSNRGNNRGNNNNNDNSSGNSSNNKGGDYQ